MSASVPWGEFARLAPDLAGRARAILTGHPHHVIATVRGDGSPRVGGTNVFVTDDALWIGMMTVAARVGDLRSEPRCAIHSAPIDEHLAHGDLRLDLTAEEAADALAVGLLASTGNGGPGVVFTLEIRRVSLVRVDGEELVVETWRPGTDVSVARHRS